MTPWEALAEANAKETTPDGVAEEEDELTGEGAGQQESRASARGPLSWPQVSE